VNLPVLAAAAAGTAAAAVHAYVFARESLLFHRRSTQQMFDIAPGHADAVQLWAFHQGIYNALLGTTSLVGALALLLGARTVGSTLIVASSATMIIAAIALVAADPRPARLPGFLAQAAPAVAAMTAVLFA
jgi:putative membrane protein